MEFPKLRNFSLKILSPPKTFVLNVFVVFRNCNGYDLIGNGTSCRQIPTVIIYTRDWQIGLPLCGRPILLITHMIADRIERYKVLLALLTLWLPDQICNSPYFQPYDSSNVSSENLIFDQLLIPKWTFFFILITYLVDIVLVLWGEIPSWSLLGVKGLTVNSIRTPTLLV